jgi:mRNA interferase MazF
LKRGAIVTVVLPGDFGKPRPALVVQSTLFAEHPTLTLVPLTSELRDLPLFRITIEPDAENGLHARSQLMIDKIHTVARTRIGATIGQLDAATIRAADRAIALWLGFA